MFIFRDSFDQVHTYEPIACIEYRGSLKKTGKSTGHYICDVKNMPEGQWYRTNDNEEPIQILDHEVSNLSYVTLFRRK